MGRHASGKPPAQQLREVKSKHREIMRRQLAGESQRRISKELDISETRLSIVVNSPLYKKEYGKLEAEVKGRFVEVQANVQERVTKLQPKAIDVLEGILTQRKVDDILVSLPLKKDVALEVLELGGNRKRTGTGSGDAMSDVVKLISESFALARENMKAAREDAKNDSIDNDNEREIEHGIIIDTSADDVTIDIDTENEESSNSEMKALPQAVNV